MEEVTLPVFDTLFLPSEVRNNRAHLFAVALGMMVNTKNGFQPKTENDTNLYCPGMLDAPRTMIVKSIDCHFVDEHGIIPATSRWYAETAIEFIVLQKPYWQSTLAKCVSTAALIDAQVSLDKQLSVDDLLRLKEEHQTDFQTPVLIEQQAYFTVKVTFSEWCKWVNGWHPEKLVCYLNGQQKRAVQ